MCVLYWSLVHIPRVVCYKSTHIRVHVHIQKVHFSFKSNFCNTETNGENKCNQKPTLE